MLNCFQIRPVDFDKKSHFHKSSAFSIYENLTPQFMVEESEKFEQSLEKVIQ